MQRLGGQVRTDWGQVTGWDFGAALALARAGSISETAVYEFLPWIEAEMVKGRAALREADDPGDATEIET